ncbi:MAG TPA: hypothetical protein VLF16_07000 [Pseudomonas sp.]|nr:hypothetical protein [Pseudomonas sp.]
MSDLATKCIAFEDGTMTTDEIQEFFQFLIDNGVIGQLQGFYQRYAYELVAHGVCHE